MWEGVWRAFLSPLDQAGRLQWERAFLPAQKGGEKVGLTRRGKGSKVVLRAPHRPPPGERPEQRGEAGRGGLEDGEGGQQDKAQGAERRPAQKASGPGYPALHPPPKERPAKAWKEGRHLRLSRAMGRGEDLRLAGELPEMGGAVGAEGPCLSRLPTPGLHPHPAQSHFGMSSKQVLGN